MNYYPTAPTYYDYGNNVTYQGDNVYVNGQDEGTADEYSQQASSLADTGTQTDASDQGDWLPLGVFAISQSGQSQSNTSLQLAVNKQGIIRGNYTTPNATSVVKGSVDKQNQKVAFSLGDPSGDVVETGLYNLTKDEAPALVHIGQNKTEQWLLVRLQQPAGQQ